MSHTLDEAGAILISIRDAGLLVGGAGANTQVAYWTAANTIAGDAGLTYDPATDTITLAGGLVLTGGLNSVITVNGGVASALTLVDDNAVEYLRLDTDPQLVVIWNNGEADIDHRWGASGIPNALFIRGSDGYIGAGLDAPQDKFHIKADNAGGRFILLDRTANASVDEIFNIGVSVTTREYMFLGKLGTVDVVITEDGDVGLQTTTPSRILDCNDGSGNMIADGYDNHPSWLANKVDPILMTNVVERFKNLGAYEYKRIPFVSANELMKLAIEEFGQERWDVAFPDGFHGRKLGECPDPEILLFLDEQGDGLRAERRLLPKWQRLHYSLVIDDLLTTFPDAVSRNDKGGEVSGYSLNSYVGVLHGCISELITRLEYVEARLN